MEVLEEADVAAVSDPGLRAVKKSGENNSPIDIDFCLPLLLLVPNKKKQLFCSKLVL